MLILYRGGIGTGKTRAVYRNIRESVINNTVSYLVVPEQYTVECERTLAEILPPSAPLTFEVTNFSRLANTVFRALGGLSYRYASNGTQLLFLWKTLTEAAPLLSDGGDVNPGRVKKAAGALAELHAAGIDATALSRAAKTLDPEDALRARLTDLSVTESVFRGFLSEHYDDAASDLDRLAEILKITPFFDGKALYVDGFTSFTEQEYHVLSLIAARADVTVTLTLPADADTSLAYKEAEECRRRLLAAASYNGTEFREITFAENHRSVPSLAFISAHLFDEDTGTVPPLAETDNSIRFFVGSDPYTAADFLAADIRRRLLYGARCRDFAIVARNTDAYAGILDAALKKNEIPFYLSTKVDIQNFEAIKMIYAAYAVCNGNFRLSDVLSYVKCNLSGIDRHDSDLFELYVTKWNINGRSRYADAPFCMHPDGYARPFSDADKEKLAAIEETRRRLIAPLLPFSATLSRAKTVADHCRALYTFLTEMNLEDELSRQAEKKRADGDIRGAEEEAALFPVIADTLDALCDALADTAVDADTFVELMRILFSETAIGRIPSSADAVTVGSADMLRAGEPRHMYLFGVNDGEFPAPVSDGGNFSDADRRVLSALGLALSPDLEIRASRELFSFLRAFGAARETVTLLSFAQDAAFIPLSPSGAWNRALYLSGVDAPTAIAGLSPDAFLYAKEAAAEKLGALYGTPLGNALISALPPSETRDRRMTAASASVTDAACRVTAETMLNLYGKSLILTQSRIDGYVSCPFSYFCRYILKLSENAPASFDFRDMGNFIHRALEKFFRLLSERGLHIGTLTAAEVAALSGTVGDECVAELLPPGTPCSPRLMHRIAALKRSAALFMEELREEFSQSAFTPLASELEIAVGNPHALSPVRYMLPDGSAVLLTGKIDRVDVLISEKTYYLRVIDYKTGKKKFSMEDIKKGVGLQLPLYLFSLCADAEKKFRRMAHIPHDAALRPAGMLYMETRTADVVLPEPLSGEEVYRFAKESIGRSGILLDDPVVLSAMDKEEAGRFIPYKRNKETGKADTHSLMNQEELDDLSVALGKTVVRIAGELREGIADARPMQRKGTSGHMNGTCELCPMKTVCRNV